MIDHAGLKSFSNESLRTFADLLAGLLAIPEAILDAVAGQGLAAVLGTEPATLLREKPWDGAAYAALGTPQEIAGAGDGGRNARTNYDVIALLRVAVVLKQMMDANPLLGPLVRGWAVNPRMNPFPV